MFCANISKQRHRGTKTSREAFFENFVNLELSVVLLGGGGQKLKIEINISQEINFAYKN